MTKLAERQARRRVGFLRHYAQGTLTADELFPGLLDTFSENGIGEELEVAGAEVRERLREFLAGHRPATFAPFFFGQPLTAEEAARYEQERRRKYVALLLALGINAPHGAAEQESLSNQTPNGSRR
jgi:hypothetical protein